jgi:N6-L-threonylcarbamoyladenine synthase
MTILGIETSCDETAAAIVEGKSLDEPVKVLSNVVASSEEFHKKTGGIVPEVAARKQIEVMIPVLVKALGRTKIADIDALSVTVGPGLVGSLLVGVETARVLSFVWKKPIVPVNHLQAHLYANWVGENSKVPPGRARGKSPSGPGQRQNSKLQDKNSNVPEFPVVGLVASGGHTDLVLMKGHNKLKHLGGTRDDAAGEAFDKTARMLGLGYPGGPAIAKMAMEFPITNFQLPIKLPRPMIDTEDYDFSFSGLKTAVLRQVAKVEKVDEVVQAIAFEVQEAICEVLVAKVMRAVEEFKPKSVIVAGGVAANSRLRQLLKFKVKS